MEKVVVDSERTVEARSKPHTSVVCGGGAPQA